MQRQTQHVTLVIAGLASMALMLCGAMPGMTQIALPPPPAGVAVNPANYYYWNNSTGFACLGATNGQTQGSWLLGATSGNPITAADDFHRLVSEVQAFLYVDDDGKEYQVGKAGASPTFPAVDPNLQTAGFVWNTNDPEFNFDVEFRMHLVRDVVQWEYRIKNRTPVSRRLGFRVLENIMWPPNEPKLNADGTMGVAAQKLAVEAPYYFPQGLSTNITSEYLGANIPTEWSIRYPDPADASTNYRPYWAGKQPLKDGVTIPSRLVFAKWADLTAYSWDKILTALLPANAQKAWPLKIGDALDFDTGVGLYYPIIAVGPNQTRIISGEVRMAWSETSVLGHYAVSAYAPDWIGYRDGDDPTTAAVENGYYSPSFVDVKAWVCNSSLIDDPNVNVTIDPGAGLDLVAGQSLSYTSITLRGMQDQLLKRSVDDQYSWRLQPNGTVFGRIPVRITASYSLGGTTSTVVYVNVPALPKRTLQPGTYLIGFPFTLDNNPADGVNTANARVALGPNVQLAWYDPSIKDYRYADVDDITLEPGRAYWLRAANTMTYSLQNAAPVDQRSPYRVLLSKGWNAISTPFLFSTEWGKCRVLSGDTEYSFTDAVSRGLIRPEIWAWDPVNNTYNPPSNPFPQNDLTTELKPSQGFWLYVGDTVRLAFEPEPTLAVMNAATPAARSRATGTLNNWQVNLVVQAGAAKDTLNTFGVATPDPNALGDGNIMKPPLSPNGLSAYFARRDGTRAAGDYAVYLQAPGGAKAWALEVNCAQANTEVALRWPDLTGLPPGMPVVLTDEITGQQVSLRTANGYSYNSGQGGIRRFTLQAGGPQERLQFTQVQLASGRAGNGAAVTFALTMPATVTAKWRTPTGRLVRTLSPGRSSGDLTTLTWDGCDSQGRRLPGGTYLCELYAEAADGQRIRTTVTVPVK